MPPPKFGNYLFTNLKGQAPEQSQTPSGDFPQALDELNEQRIVLRREDFRTDDPGAPTAGLVESRSRRNRASIEGYSGHFRWTRNGQGVDPATDSSETVAGPTRFRLSVSGFPENGSAPGTSELESELGRGSEADWSGF